MKPLPRQLLAIARGRRGLVTTDELTQARIVGRVRSAHFDSGLIVPVHRGVYRIGSHADSFEQRCLAACMAAPDAAISGCTAGRLWGIRKVFTDDVHLISRRAVKLAGVACHRTDLLRRSHITERAGLRVLTPNRLLCDLAWFLDDADLESVFEQMLDRRMLSVVAARDAAREFAARGRPGSVRLGSVIDSRPTWLRPVDSDLELRLWRELDRRAVTMERQHPVSLDSGITVHLDLADPVLRFGIEVDHVTWHGGRLDTQRDKRRDRELARIGWMVSRVTDDDIRDRLDSTVREIIEIAAHRSPLP